MSLGDTKMSTLKVHLDHYKSQHRTLGCKILHLIGIPVLVLSIPMFLVNRRRSAALFSLGWICQFVGHYCFERNKPVLLSEMRNPLTIVAALIYVWDGWRTVFRGCSLTDEDKSGAPASSSPVTIYRPPMKSKVRKSKVRKAN
jgi:uncharacterized membrane protein YGL010W